MSIMIWIPYITNVHLLPVELERKKIRQSQDLMLGVF